MNRHRRWEHGEDEDEVHNHADADYSPKIRSAGIFEAMLLAKEHADVVVVTNIADPVFL